MEQGRPYRKPPLVGKDKSPKAFELTSVKELDNRALYLRENGPPGMCSHLLVKQFGGAEKKAGRLFNKNTGLC